MTLPGLPNPWLILAVVVIVGGLTAGAYRKGGNDRENAILAQTARDQDIETRTFNAAMTGAAVVIAKNRSNNALTKDTLEQVIRNAYPTSPDCRTPDDGMRAVNDALANRAPSQPVSSGGVPGNVVPSH